MTPAPGELALAMGGGGARAAYQVGLLRYLAGRFPELSVPIMTGVSAGAINTAFLANDTRPFAACVSGLGELWAGLTTAQVFESNASSLLFTALRWGVRLVSGGSRLAPPTRGMVDTRPLRRFLEQALRTTDGRLPGIARKIAAGDLRAVGLTTTDYGTGQTITHVQGRDVTPWRRPNRTSHLTELTVDHVMGSAALPLFFPAVRIADAWHGDGGMRLTAPLAPALHLGATRILAVSTRYGRSQKEADIPVTKGYPPPAQVIGLLLNAVFLDMIDHDALRLDRINRLLRALDAQEHDGLRPVELMVVRPSVDLAKLAADFEPRLPQPFRFLTRGLGTRETASPDSLSMVMFEPDYLRLMMEIGERDAEARGDELCAFIAGDELPAIQRTGFWKI